MAVEQTLSILKPDAVSRNLIGRILNYFEQQALKIVAAKMVKLTTAQAEKFYEIHHQQPFYQELVAFMSSGPVLALVLEGEAAVMKNRQIMGATDPRAAEPGTIRGDLAESIACNTVHGSDSTITALREIACFFRKEEIFSRENG